MSLRGTAAALVAAATVLVAGLPGAQPGTAGVAAPAATLTATAAPTTITFGRATTVSGRLAVSGSTTGLAGEPVTLQRRFVGSTAWAIVATGTTGADGTVSMAAKPSGSADLRLVHAATATAGAAASPARRVAVRWALTARLSRTSVPIGQRMSVSGAVGPALAGRVVQLQRSYSGAWHRVATTTLSATGGYRFSIAHSTPGWRYYRVVKPADSRHLAAAVGLPRLDVYRVHTYVVRTRGTVVVDMSDFAARVAATYADPRGWQRGHHRFKRVSTGGAFTVVMAEAKYLPSYSSVCSVLYSCRAGRYVVINQNRWRLGSAYFPGPLLQYRQMVVNHETGHWLGLGHAYCSSAGALAPVMQQQSKGMQGCRPNAWPLAREINAVS